MASSPKLTDLKMPDPVEEPQDQTIDEAQETQRDYNANLNHRVQEINNKITTLESKLAKFNIKESMIDGLINQTHTELENLKENEFTKRGQKQSVLLKQMEASSVLHDTIMKYEDMIQKYHKILIDLQNNKLNAFLKINGLKKEEDEAEESLAAVLMNLQKSLTESPQSGNQIPNIALLSEIEAELQEDNYK